MIRKYEVLVEKTEAYIVEIDDSLLDEKWQENFNEDYHKVKDLKEHAEQIAKHKSRHNSALIEGYGEVLVNGEANRKVKAKELNTAINIIELHTKNELDVWSQEVIEGQEEQEV